MVFSLLLRVIFQSKFQSKTCVNFSTARSTVIIFIAVSAAKLNGLLWRVNFTAIVVKDRGGANLGSRYSNFPVSAKFYCQNAFDSSVQNNSVPWLFGSSAAHEGWFSRDLLPVFSTFILLPLLLSHRCHQQSGDWLLFCFQCWQCLRDILRQLSWFFPEICWRGWVRIDIPVGLQLFFGPVSYAAIEEDCTCGLNVEVFYDSDKVGADVILLYGCQQSCLPNPV